MAISAVNAQALLNQLDASIDWELLARPIRAVYRNADGGSPAEPVVMMIKILMLQKWFNLSDPQAEEQLNDRMSFRRFVGLRGAACTRYRGERRNRFDFAMTLVAHNIRRGMWLASP